MNYGNKTDEWLKYTRSTKYNNSLKPNYYDTVNTNIAFVAGDQWRNVQSNGQPTPTFNFIKKTINVVVSFITSSKIKIKLSPLAYNEDTDDQDQIEQQHASEVATSEIENLFEKFKMENRGRDACHDAATMGDTYAHMYFNPDSKPYNGMLGEHTGEIEFELVNGTNVFHGNANNPIVSTKVQPYMIISGRDMVENLKEEARIYQSKGGEEGNIQSDTHTQYEAGDMAKIEIEGDEWGKALYIIVYTYDKKTKTIRSTKCTESAYMWKDVDTEMSGYPIAGFPWEKQKNQSHGRALATGMIPNQIFINKMFAMVMYHLMMSAFPKVIYDKEKIGSWDNTVSGSIGLKMMMPGDSVRNAAAYMEPGNMSTQITQVIDMAIKYTKETLGIDDAFTGNVNPEQASGTSIATAVKQSSIPLENPRANMYEWYEDIGRILVDMMGTYYGERPIVVTRDGKKVIETFDFSVLKNLWLSVKCDVGPSTYWSEIQQVQMLNNLLAMKDPTFQVIDFVETLPQEYRSQELVDRLKENVDKIQQAQKLQQEQSMAMSKQSQQIQGQTQELQGQQQQLKYQKMMDFFDTLDEKIQHELKKLPDAKFEQAIEELMNNPQLVQGGQ